MGEPYLAGASYPGKVVSAFKPDTNGKDRPFSDIWGVCLRPTKANCAA